MQLSYSDFQNTLDSIVVKIEKRYPIKLERDRHAAEDAHDRFQAAGTNHGHLTTKERHALDAGNLLYWFCKLQPLSVKYNPTMSNLVSTPANELAAIFLAVAVLEADIKKHAYSHSISLRLAFIESWARALRYQDFSLESCRFIWGLLIK